MKPIFAILLSCLCATAQVTVVPPVTNGNTATITNSQTTVAWTIPAGESWFQVLETSNGVVIASNVVNTSWATVPSPPVVYSVTSVTAPQTNLTLQYGVYLGTNGIAAWVSAGWVNTNEPCLFPGTIVLERSTNELNWTPVTTNDSLPQPWTYTDVNPPQPAYYRAVGL